MEDINNVLKNPKGKEDISYQLFDNDEIKNLKIIVFGLLADKNPTTKTESRLQAEESLVEYLKNKYNPKSIRSDLKREVWVYQEGIYIPEGATVLKEDLRHILDSVYNENGIKKIIDKLVTEVGIDAKDFFSQVLKDNLQYYLLPVNNGILNIKSGELLPFSPKYIFFGKLEYNYNPEATCPTIVNHLKTVLNSEDDIILFQEALGNCLFRKYIFQKAVMMEGTGRNGKSVTLDLIEQLIGDNNISALTLQEFEEDPFSIFQLFGKLANIAGEIPSTVLKICTKFKNATGDDTLQANRKFLSPVLFKNYAKMFFSCNTLPPSYDDSVGFWERWIYFSFPYTFLPKDEVDPDNEFHKIRDTEIKDKLFTKDEMEGFLVFALEGIQRLLKNKEFSKSETSEKVKIMWSLKADSFKAFCEEKIITIDEYDEKCKNYIVKKELKLAYLKYCKDNKAKSCAPAHIKTILESQYAAEINRLSNNGDYIWENIIWKDNKNNIDKEIFEEIEQ